jgi:anti-sigma regulatory factor (Ser/Thr protein kinase)
MAPAIGRERTASRSFAPYSYSPRDSRTFVRNALAGSQCDDLTPTAELLVSELVTNVVMHAMTDVEVSIASDDDGLRVAVSDGSSILPSMREVAGADGGFGLRFLDTLADAWGVEATDDGKCVWFSVKRPHH